MTIAPPRRGPVTFPGGKLPAQPARPQLHAARFLDSAALPPPPESVDWLDPVPSWPMYGNDEISDCVFAGVGHHEQQISALGQGAEVRVTDADVIGGYSAVTGYVPGDPSTDRGTYVQDAMGWWRKTGIAGHRILAYASIDPSDLTLVKQAIRLFGSVGVGFNFPRSAMGQFNRGEPWDVVAGSSIEGGHYVMVGAYDARYVESVTWAARQKMTYAFWRRYVDEVWMFIDDEMVNSLTGLPFSGGIDLAAFAADFTALTGETVPLPAPPPPPAPQREAVTAADRRLKAAVEVWARRDALCGRPARRALVSWFGAKQW